MFGGISTSTKPSGGGGPKSRTCYICGRQYMLHSFDIHVAQCRKLYEEREATKPVRERRPCPTDPMNDMYGGYTPANLTRAEVDKMNDASFSAWNSSLSQCENCGRTFLPEKLAIHKRSCTADNPARRITDSVKKGDASINVNLKGSYDVRTSNNFESTRSSASASDNISNSPRPASGRASNTNIPPPRSGLSRALESDTYSLQSTAGRTPAASSISNISKSKQKTGPQVNFPPQEGGFLQKCPHCSRSFNEKAYEKHVPICLKVFKSQRKSYDSKKHRYVGTDMAELVKPTGKNGRALGKSVKLAATATVSSGASGAQRDWRFESQQFRSAIRAARLHSAETRRSGVASSNRKSTSTNTGMLPSLGSARGGKPTISQMRNELVRTSSFTKSSPRTTLNSGANDQLVRRGSSTLPPPVVRASSFNKPLQPMVDPSFIQCPHCLRKYSQVAGERHIPKCRDIIHKPTMLMKGTGTLANQNLPRR